MDIKEWRNEADKLTDEFKDYLSKHLAKQEALFRQYPCEDHDHSDDPLLAERGFVIDFVVCAAVVSHDDDGDQVTGYLVVQDEDRPRYVKTGLIEECLEQLH